MGARNQSCRAAWNYRASEAGSGRKAQSTDCGFGNDGDALEDPTSARGGVKKDGKQKVLTLKEYAWIQLLN